MFHNAMVKDVVVNEIIRNFKTRKDDLKAMQLASLPVESQARASSVAAYQVGWWRLFSF